ncbi:coiled-coil domain-containing protein [Cordyceps javanica]|uniref:Coiled-coil domain-containing protein n=1 Tax=Cordyceps javanica TaxID=43265 RepID=A0A545VRE8_9HYPO|nr:coiled-coil domain-containing protein [Cordyceps javanica]TQW04245.1 coiled-coil domain-containing protein [Cordyceps javanica]
MVYYYSSAVVDPPGFIYVGKDKFENKLSSAHIYLRMQEGQKWDSLPQELVMDLAQLTKANSIEGNKKDNITVIYTPWSNLKKDGSMDVGQVSFKNPRLVRRVVVPQRENPIVNRLNKTKTEVKQPDLKQQKDDRDKEIRRKANASLQIKASLGPRIARQENMDMQSNQNRTADWEDDFM